MSHRLARTGGSLPYKENFVAQRPLFSVNLLFPVALRDDGAAQPWA
jgi:hypothetical protein